MASDFLRDKIFFLTGFSETSSRSNIPAFALGCCVYIVGWEIKQSYLVWTLDVHLGYYLVLMVDARQSLGFGQGMYVPVDVNCSLATAAANQLVCSNTAFIASPKEGRRCLQEEETQAPLRLLQKLQARWRQLRHTRRKRVRNDSFRDSWMDTPTRELTF